MTAFRDDDRLARLVLASLGYAPDHDGFDHADAESQPDAIAAPSAEPFLTRLTELAETAGRLGLWQTTRLLTRLLPIARAELSHALADELAPSGAHREDVPNAIAMFGRRAR
jgi:hypothetical protein